MIASKNLSIRYTFLEVSEKNPLKLQNKNSMYYLELHTLAFLEGFSFFLSIHSLSFQPCLISKVTHQHTNNGKLILWAKIFYLAEFYSLNRLLVSKNLFTSTLKLHYRFQ